MIKLAHLSKSFQSGSKNLSVLHDLSLSVQSGEMIAIMGRSGSGKSTLLHILAGLISPDEGSYLFEEEETTWYDFEKWAAFRHEKIGYILQNNWLLFDRNVTKNIMLPLNFTNLTQDQKMNHISMLAQKLGIDDRMNHMPYQLSGGEQQRVALARALAMGAPLLLADEPTGSLDAQTEQEILDFFDQLHAGGKTIIIVTHDMDVARRCERVYRLENGKLSQTE